MNFIYVNRGASPSKFDGYLKQYNNHLQQQAQKYNQLLMEGIVENGGSVFSVSTRPINRSMTKQLFFRGERETENGIDYHYIPFFNIKLLRELSVFIGVFFKIFFSKYNSKKTVVVCDCLNIAASVSVITAATLRRYKTIGIVTDVPGHSYSKSFSRSAKFNLAIMQKFDSYLLLTEPMSQIVNPHNRPFIVLEGHSDIAMRKVVNTVEGKGKKRVCLYAGSLRKIYGIQMLVEGFLAAAIPDTELHIYGEGDYVNELQDLILHEKSVKYFGVASNSDIVKAEIEATLLINPRPSHEEYTRYSFPSKNMEYMASGTPVLTTRLPGMPEDHKPYVYFIEQENAEGIKIALEQVLSQDAQTLHEFGMKAKEFVLAEKNNCSQAAKVLDFLRETF